MSSAASGTMWYCTIRHRKRKQENTVIPSGLKAELTSPILTRREEYEVNKGKLYGLSVYAKALKSRASLAIRHPTGGRTDKRRAEITNCQSNDFRKPDSHLNASLAAVKPVKAARERNGTANSKSSRKSFIHNAYMLERFIRVFRIIQKHASKLLTNFSKNSVTKLILLAAIFNKSVFFL